MPFIYNIAKKEINDGTIDLLADTIKVMLVTSSYVADPDHNVVDAAGANDPIDHEIAVTGYTGGFGGAGRKTLGSKTIVEDDTNDRSTFDAADPTAWTLGAGTTIHAAILIKETGADDTTTRLISYHELDTPFPTNGGDFTLNFNALGIHNLNNS